VHRLAPLQIVTLGLLVAFVVVPITMPVIFSFSVYWQDILPEGFTLRWYEKFLAKPATSRSLTVSLVVASSAVLLNLLIAVPAGYAISRMKGRVRAVTTAIARVLPLVLPPVIVGTALLLAFSGPPLALSGTIWMVIIAHTLLGFPFMIRNTLASFDTLDIDTLSEAAASLGAHLWQRLRWVIVPNVLPGILSGALLVFAISIGEFEVTSMVAGFEAQTLPLQLFQQIRNDMRIASAISAFLVYVSLVCFLGMTWLGGHLRERRG